MTPTVACPVDVVSGCCRCFVRAPFWLGRAAGGYISIRRNVLRMSMHVWRVLRLTNAPNTAYHTQTGGPFEAACLLVQRMSLGEARGLALPSGERGVGTRAHNATVAARSGLGVRDTDWALARQESFPHVAPVLCHTAGHTASPLVLRCRTAARQAGVVRVPLAAR